LGILATIASMVISNPAIEAAFLQTGAAAMR
jgi:hypothetical protein